MKHLVVSYDISSHKLRRAVAKILDDYGDRAQESVFELIEIEDFVWEKCLKRLNKLKLEEFDSLRIYHLCEKCLKNVQVIGSSRKLEPPEVFIV